MAPTPEEAPAVPLSDPYRWVTSPCLVILDARLVWHVRLDYLILQLINTQFLFNKVSLFCFLLGEPKVPQSMLTFVLYQSSSWCEGCSSWSSRFRKGNTGDLKHNLALINSQHIVLMLISSLPPWQSPRLKVAYNACHLATGDLLRWIHKKWPFSIQPIWAGQRSDLGLSWAKRSNLWLTRWNIFLWYPNSPSMQ